MASINKYFIGPSLLGDIRRTIARVDSDTYRVNGGMRREVHQEMMQPPGGGKVFHVCTFTGSWSKNQNKTITFRGVTATPNTVVATNLFANINTASAPQTSFSCAIAKDGTAWYLISAECFL